MRLLGSLLLVGAAVVVAVGGLQLPELRRWLAEAPREPSGAASSEAAPRAAMTFAAGIAAAFMLPGDAHPIKAALKGSHLLLLGVPEGERNLSLFTYDGARTDRRPLPLPSVGVIAGLAVGTDEKVWVGAGDTLVRVDANRAVHRFAVPRPRHTFAAQFRGPAAPPDLPPTEDGQITAVAVAGGRVLLGRLGFPEITVFDPTTSSFEHVALGGGLGDVASFAQGPGAKVFFTVNRSGRTPGLLFDSVGIYDANTAGSTLAPHPARALASNGRVVAFSGYGFGRLDAAGVLQGPVVPSGEYDQTRIGLRSDGTLIAKVAGDRPDIAFLSGDRSELTRIRYSAVQITDRIGRTTVYSSALSFVIVDGRDVVWFGLFGRPEVYKLT